MRMAKAETADLTSFNL